MATALEQKRALRLIQSRRKNQPQALRSDVQKPGSSLGWKAVFGISAFLMLIFTIIADVLDFFLIGQIPVLFDIFDFIVWFSIWAWVYLTGLDRPPAFIGAMFFGIFIEMLPFVEFIPTYTILVLIILIYNTAVKKVVKKGEF